MKAKNCLGFTLIEMMVVVALFSVIALMAVNIFFITLRTGVKAELVKEIKQNGDYAVSTMERMIRNAREIHSDTTCDGSSQSSIKIVNPDYLTTEFSCGSQIASQSAVATTYLTSSELTVDLSSCFFTCQRPVSNPETVTISFTLSQTGTPDRPEEIASATFQTAISLRSH